MANNISSNDGPDVLPKTLKQLEEVNEKENEAVLCVYKSIVLADHAITLRKVNQDPEVLELHVNTSHFSTTTRQVTHHHVNKPLNKSNLSIEILHGKP